MKDFGRLHTLHGQCVTITHAEHGPRRAPSTGQVVGITTASDHGPAPGRVYAVIVLQPEGGGRRRLVRGYVDQLHIHVIQP